MKKRRLSKLERVLKTPQKVWLAMKLSFVFSILLTLNISAAVYSQQNRVSLTLNEVTLDQFIDAVKKQTGVSFLYNSNLFKGTGKVSVAVSAEQLDVVLRDILGEQGYVFDYQDQVVVIRKASDVSAEPQRTEKRTIKGVVKDEGGATLPGVSVVVKGAQTGVATDINGHYEIRVDDRPEVVLQFSFVGMKTQEVKIGNRHDIQVVLAPDTKALEEVVVTGYQTISRERATGSFDKIDNKVLEARPTSDLTSALQGVVAGMQATENLDGTVEFQIRGTSSLYADKQPLIVVDGFPIEGSFNSINPNDVESVTVLKDAAAASIWGARSANGVIVVTTKTGKKDKLDVNVRAFYRIGRMTDLDYVLDQADSRTHVDYELKALENNWVLGGEYTPSFSNFRSSLTLAQELYYQNKYFGLSEADMNAGLEKLRNTSNRKQLKDLLMRHQSLQQYNISISGGTEKARNYFSMMYEKNNEGTIDRGYNRIMLTYNNQYQITKWLKTSLMTSYFRKNTESSGPTMGEFTNLSPYELLLNPDGSYATNLYAYNRYEVSQVPMDQMPYEDWSYNLLREVRGREITSKTDLLRAQFGLTADLLPGLVYDFSVQYETSRTQKESYYNEDTYKVRNTVNSMTEYNSGTKTVGISRIPKGGISETPSESEFYNYVLRNKLAYNRDFGKHAVTALAGLDISEYNTKSATRPTIYGYDKEKKLTAVPSYGYGSVVDKFTDFWGNVGSTIAGGSTTLTERTDRYVSYYAVAGYTYDSKYGISFSARGDGSNFVSDDPKLRWAPMWSVGALWHLGKENFMNDLSWMDRLSLRFTYGLNGNVEKSTSPLALISMGSTVSSTTGTVTSSVASMGNPDLKWETTKTTNIGLDFSFFGNKLSGKLDYYNRAGEDIIGQVAIPAVNGTTSLKLNNAAILNRGFEVELTGNLQTANRAFGWRTTVTYAYNKNEVKDLYYPSIYAYQLAEGTFVEGRPVGCLYSYNYAGTEDGIPYVYGLNGNKVSMNDVSLHNRTVGLSFMSYEGTQVPPHTLGWVNNFSYKGFSLYVFVTGNFGGIFRRPTNSSMPGVGGSKTSVGRFMSDVFESDGSEYPTFPNAGEKQYYLWNRYIPNLSYFVESSSFIRLKEITLDYNLPSAWMKKIKMNGIRLFVQARDLGLIYSANKKHYDPEWLPGSNKPVTTYTFGADIKF